jgi:hypothetical protein
MKRCACGHGILAHYEKCIRCELTPPPPAEEVVKK